MKLIKQYQVEEEEGVFLVREYSNGVKKRNLIEPSIREKTQEQIDAELADAERQQRLEDARKKFVLDILKEQGLI